MTVNPKMRVSQIIAQKIRQENHIDLVISRLRKKNPKWFRKNVLKKIDLDERFASDANEIYIAESRQAPKRTIYEMTLNLQRLWLKHVEKDVYDESLSDDIAVIIKSFIPKGWVQIFENKFVKAAAYLSIMVIILQSLLQIVEFFLLLIG